MIQTRPLESHEKWGFSLCPLIIVIGLYWPHIGNGIPLLIIWAIMFLAVPPKLPTNPERPPLEWSKVSRKAIAGYYVVGVILGLIGAFALRMLLYP